MKRFVTVSIVAGFLHFIATIVLVAALDSAGWAIERGEPNHLVIWLSLIWILAPIPMFLSRFIHPLSPMHLLTLGLPWSLFIGLCCGFVALRLSRCRRQIV